MGIKDKVSAEELAANVNEAVGKANQDEQLQGEGQGDLGGDKEGPARTSMIPPRTSPVAEGPPALVRPEITAR